MSGKADLLRARVTARGHRSLDANDRSKVWRTTPRRLKLASVEQDVASVASIRAQAEQRVDKHQRRIEVLTAALGRPRTVYVTLALVIGWGAFNVLGPTRLGWPRIDPPPFFWLQGMVALAALLMTTLVLITANRQTRNAEERSHLDLQVNLLAEHKVAKLIALIEELRRDLPMVRDRIDREAEAMQEAVDPHAVLAALAKASDTEPTEDKDKDKDNTMSSAAAVTSERSRPSE
jgi:uncharacterized membrane protein